MANTTSDPNQKSKDQRSKSCETACSSNSSCFFQKRKPLNPLASSLRSSVSRSTATSSVRQRVLSAKLLKLKSVQNQLNDVNFHLAEVIRENQALKTLQKRQDRALTKYEGENAELPRLIRAHEEEIRILTEKNKTLRKAVKELNDQLKHRNEEILNLQEQLKHFEKLNKDKHLLEREKLIEDLADYKQKLQKADNEIVVLNRKLTLETKTSKQRLNAEISKHKQCQKELTQSLVEIGRVTKLLEGRDKVQNSNGRKRFSNLLQRQTVSLVNLNSTKSSGVSDYLDVNDEKDKVPVTEVKLEPIQSKTSESPLPKPYKSILKCPLETIKARLSASSRKDVEDELPIDKLSATSDSSGEIKTDFKQSRPNSSQKLEKIEFNLHDTLKKFEKNEEQDEIGRRLGDYCLEAIDSVKTYSNVIADHKENFANAKADTNILISAIKDAESMELKLKKSQAMTFDKNMTDDNLDFVNQILSEEIEFKKKYKDRNGDADKKSEVGLNDKKKLLATLRAIDNGDSVDSFEHNGDGRKSKLMHELFGDSDD